MKKITKNDLEEAIKIIDGEMEKLSSFSNGDNWLVPPSVGAKVLGISLQAMEERMRNDSIKVFDSFGKKYLLGDVLRNHFLDRAETLTLKFNSLNKLETSSLKKIVAYAKQLKEGTDIYPPL